RVPGGGRGPGPLAGPAARLLPVGTAPARPGQGSRRASRSRARLRPSRADVAGRLRLRSLERPGLGDDRALPALALALRRPLVDGALDRDAASVPRLSPGRVRVLLARRVARARHDAQVAAAPGARRALAGARHAAPRQDGLRDPDRPLVPHALRRRSAAAPARARRREPSLSRAPRARARARGV